MICPLAWYGLLRYRLLIIVLQIKDILSLYDVEQKGYLTSPQWSLFNVLCLGRQSQNESPPLDGGVECIAQWLLTDYLGLSSNHVMYLEAVLGLKYCILCLI